MMKLLLEIIRKSEFFLMILSMLLTILLSPIVWIAFYTMMVDIPCIDPIQCVFKSLLIEDFMLDVVAYMDWQIGHSHAVCL
jgi:hypothetical protein